MAMKPKEGGLHSREKSSSAPSTPRSGNTNTTHGRRESTDDGEVHLVRRKPMPNYLKPTVSSSHDICPCSNKQPSSEPPVIAVKRLVRRKSIDKVPSTTIQHVKATRSSNATTNPKEKTPKASTLSPKSTISPRLVSDSKAFKPPKTVKPSSSKNGNKPKPKEKVGDFGTKGKKEDKHSPPNGHLVGLDDGDEHYEGSGESLAGEEPAKARRGKPTLSVVELGNVGMPRRLKLRPGREEGELEKHENVTLKKQDGKGKKESPRATNQVIEEAASKLVGKRRSKVTAFETAISLHEPQPSHFQQEVEKGEVNPEGAAKEVVAKEVENAMSVHKLTEN